MTRYYYNHIDAPLEPGEYRDLPDGRHRICCLDCGQLVDTADLDAIPAHGCIGKPRDRDGTNTD